MVAVPQADRIEGIGSLGSPAGLVLTVQGGSADTGSIAPSGAGAFRALAEVYGFDSTNWQRLQTLLATGDANNGQAILTSAPFMRNPAGTMDSIRGDSTNGQTVNLRRLTLVLDAASGANAAVTATLPAAGAGLFHYITHVRLSRSATAAIAGTIALATTSTNLGGIVWQYGNACPIGSTNIDCDQEYATPIKSAVANTASTIVTPAIGAAGFSRIQVVYYVGP